MEVGQIAGYKKGLERERVLLIVEIGRNEKPVDFGSGMDHFDEEADETEEIGNQQAVAQDLKNRLDAIDIALEKIRAGSYGLCEQCKKDIEPVILDIDPESRFCKHCKLNK